MTWNKAQWEHQEMMIKNQLMRLETQADELRHILIAMKAMKQRAPNAPKLEPQQEEAASEHKPKGGGKSA